MLTTAQHDRIARKCAAALSAVIDALPQLVADSDPDTAAMIAADLVKACLVGPTPEVDPGAALAEVIRRCAEMDSTEPAQPAADSIAYSWSPSTEPATEPPAAPDDQTEDHESELENDLPEPYEAQILSSPSHTWDD